MFFQNATADFITKRDGLLLKSATEQRFNHVELPKYGYTHVGRKRRTWSCGVFLYFDYKRDREEQHAKTLLLFFNRWVHCSTVKDHSYFVEICLFVSPCFHSDIFLTWGHSHSKHAERVPFISLHGLLNVGCFYRVGFEAAYFDATFYPLRKPDN